MESSDRAEAMAEVELVLESLAYSLDMLGERLQNGGDLDSREAAAFIWTSARQAQRGAERLREAEDALEASGKEGNVLPPFPPNAKSCT